MSHRKAIDKAVRSEAVLRTSRYAPLVELCRVLADQMDAAGDEPSTRLSAAYLSALKDLGRAVSATAVTAPQGASVAEMRNRARERRGDR